MRQDPPFYTRPYANELRQKLGLPTATSPNASSDTARELGDDVESVYSYFERLVELIRDPSQGRRHAAVRDFLGHVYEWANFVYAACGAFDDAVRRERYGDTSAHGLMRAAHNVTRELFAGLGVRLRSVVRPEPFREAARSWSPEEVEEARQAVTQARQALRDVVLAEMRKYLPDAGARAAHAKLSRTAHRVWEYIRNSPYMPTYDEMAVELQMGRSTISEAMKELRSRGPLGDASELPEPGPK